MNRNVIVLIIAAIALLTLALICVLTVQKPQPVACTEEALLCPDGSAVGRIAPDCRFAPCPNCACPEGYVQEGDACNPKCYYSNPRCLMPSAECNAMTEKNSE